MILVVAMNPFKPTAGKTPPELIGRDTILSEFEEGLANGPGAPERLMRITGARGMGKTVLLNKLGDIAEACGWAVVNETASEGFCARILSSLAPKTRVIGARLQPSAFGVSLGELDLEHASLSLREAMAKATAGGKGLLITLDEVQDSSHEEIRALAVAMQHMIREDANVGFVFAGLASMVDSIVNGKTLTFLRRAVPVELGVVDVSDVADSYRFTMDESGMSISNDLLDAMATASSGYPFMVQLVGYHTWQAAYRRFGTTGAVRDRDVQAGIEKAHRDFDRMVIEPALQALSPSLVSYLLAMAQDEDQLSETSVIAERLGKDVKTASPQRAELIKMGIIETPLRGRVAFAVPMLGDYLVAHEATLREQRGL